MRFTRALLAGCVIAVTACSDDPVSPNGVSGSLSYSYTIEGSSATTYNASGSIPSSVGNSSNFGSSAWAAGGVDQTNNFVIIGAAVPKTSSTWDLTSISVARTTPGTSQIEESCDAESSECTGVFVFFDQGLQDANFTNSCVLTTGSVTISSISSSNITGTFSGSGLCFSSTGDTSDFTVTNGTFNVGVTTQLID